MSHLLRATLRPVTYSRWLHLCVPLLAVAVWLYVFPRYPWGPALLIPPLGLVPWVRLMEGLQAQFLLTPAERGRADGAISTARASTWADRWRTALWLEVRLLVGVVTVGATTWLPFAAVDLAAQAVGHPLGGGLAPTAELPRWVAAALVPVPLALLFAVVVLLGRLITAVARQLLGPSAAERLSVLEERTEQLLERARIARELHDSIGHALTVAVMQAGAARAAGDAGFTERALAAIEDTGRAALEDLERVLLVLRESGPRPSAAPTLAEADRLLESARGSGAAVEAELTGPLDRLPGPVAREGYRILQESLTNVLRHCGPVPVRVRIVMGADELELEVVNALPRVGAPQFAGGGSGLRGIRERAALLGGVADTGPYRGQWRVRARLPLAPAR
ncbi:sensor histidine kinase [Streptomyces sp. NPDC093225]|uniref:sensor histidine kinase n=1 Tax=Streptomyces sp. NPDC093225 TaxID=3366034 RepID=UPI00382A1957